MRRANSDRQGQHFDAATIEAVWTKGQIVSGVNPVNRRKDVCGAWIDRNQYGSTCNTGWEIDHIVAVASGGSDLLPNLQPLQWENNRSKGDGPPVGYCTVTASA